MKIDGKLIASEIKDSLRLRIETLKKRNIIPHLAVILIGNDPSSAAYVRQKLKTGENLNARVTLTHLEKINSYSDLAGLVNRYNSDASVHGIIIQRPVRVKAGKEDLDKLVIPGKDIDGFHPESLFTPPIALAVIKIIEYIYRNNFKNKKYTDFNSWLSGKKILVIGRGDTGGKPVAAELIKRGYGVTIGHSKTDNLKELCLTSDIIISCVGKSDIVRHDMVTGKTVLIGVGLHPEDGKLNSDYNQPEISSDVAFYTPVPGGVGPVNVACLFENLLKATEILNPDLKTA